MILIFEVILFFMRNFFAHFSDDISRDIVYGSEDVLEFFYYLCKSVCYARHMEYAMEDEYQIYPNSSDDDGGNDVEYILCSESAHVAIIIYFYLKAKFNAPDTVRNTKMWLKTYIVSIYHFVKCNMSKIIVFRV